MRRLHKRSLPGVGVLIGDMVADVMRREKPAVTMTNAALIIVSLLRARAFLVFGCGIFLLDNVPENSRWNKLGFSCMRR